MPRYPYKTHQYLVMVINQIVEDFKGKVQPVNGYYTGINAVVHIGDVAKKLGIEEKLRPYLGVKAIVPLKEGYEDLGSNLEKMSLMDYVQLGNSVAIPCFVADRGRIFGNPHTNMILNLK